MEISNDVFERIYWATKDGYKRSLPIFRTIFFRFRKFIALPYCYFRFVDWKECNISRVQVLSDLFYIFFKLKYFPENYGYCRLWEKKRVDWKYYYGSNYDAYQSYRLGKEVQKTEYQILFSDKEVSSQICEGLGIKMAKVLGILEPDEDYISKLKAIITDSRKDKLILKPTRGHGGGGVYLAFVENNHIYVMLEDKKVNIDKLKLKERYLVQEYVEQINELSKLTNSASIRLITLLTKTGDVIFLSAEINTAVDSSYVSNWSAGGIGIGVDTETGNLREVGYDKYGRGYREHPISKIKFSEYSIPQWDEICDFARKIQEVFPYYKLLGPDITLCEEGPILYEINATPDIGSTEQYNGPLLINTRIREEFIKYNLLINNTLQ